MKIYNFEQRTPEWYAVRNLKLTASHACEIGNCGKGLESYIIKIMSEHYTKNQEESFANPSMDRGKELESEAISIYELETGQTVTKVGFVEASDHSGCSPDGLVCDDGGIEIKCHKGEIYMNLIFDQKIDTKYDWQIQMNLLLTGRKWWDYVAYSPYFKRPLFIKRFYPDLEKQKMLLKGIEIGTQKIKEKLAIANAYMGIK